MASTFPVTPGDGTPGFVRDLAVQEGVEFDTTVLVPRVGSAKAREVTDGITIERFAYFPRRWEDLADGAIIENLRGRPSRWLQVPAFLAAEIIALRRAIRRYKPDLLHVHWVVPQGVAALIGGRRLPWLVTTLGGDVYALNDPLSRWLKRAVLRRSRAVTTMNHDMRTRLVQLGARDATTTVLPMGADVDTIRVAAKGIARVPGRLVFVGRLVEKKGVTVLLDAVQQLGDGWSLQIIGDGPLRAELEAKAARVAPAGSVEFLGTVGRQRLAEAYAAASVVVFPSVPAASGDQDGLCVALLEAMSLGRAVVSSSMPGADTAIEDGVNGLLVPPGDAQALAAALRRLLDDPSLVQRLGKAAQPRGESFSVEAIGAKYRALLGEVLAGGSVR
jgi:glycosyltransferase involved in cell wall biosynthesis